MKFLGRSVCVQTGLLIVLLPVFQGCATPTKFVYRGKDDPQIHYISKDEPSFNLDIPGTNWSVQNPQPNVVMFRSTSGPRRLITIFEYSDGLLRQRFYKKGVTEEAALQTYYETESEYHITREPSLQKNVVARNAPGPIVPNLIWSLEGPQTKLTFLTMSKNRHLISISLQEFDPPFNEDDLLLQIYRSIKLLTQDQARDQINSMTSN